MSELLKVSVLVSAFTASALLTGWLRGFALSREVLDIPSARSSHLVPTPRGGGVSIVLVVLLALPVLTSQAVLLPPSLWAFLGAGLSVGAIGWLDDRSSVAVGWRLCVHFGAALWALAWLGGLRALPVFGSTIELGLMGDAITVLYLVWLLNLYNFMDGIDGIAGIEAVTVCFGGAVLLRLFPGSEDAWLVPSLVGASVGGFLIWNFPRARIFMETRAVASSGSSWV